MTKFDWIKFEHQRFVLMARRVSYKDVVNNNRSRRFFIPGFLPYTLRAVLRTFKFIPDKFVEPGDEQINPNSEQ